jgi:GH15 family glucan-1,4-alpha-glucosidase
MKPPNGYKPIADYGIIGNLRTTALIGKDGSIDWCCLPFMDHPSVFSAILDAQRGGLFKITVHNLDGQSQEYVKDTNVLLTHLDSPAGRLTITDFMPLDGKLDGIGSSTTEAAIYRVLQVEGSAMRVCVEWSPRFDYARDDMRIEPAWQGFIAEGETGNLSLGGLPEGSATVTGDVHGPSVMAEFTLEAGNPLVLATRWDSTDCVVVLEDVLERLERTISSWRSWVHKEEINHDRSWASPWAETIVRSELVLKLLTHADTGAIAAAPTTSLPETMGGVRNWDYRYSWIRDSAMMAQALFALGHRAEARDFVNWAERAARSEGEKEWGLQIMYGLDGHIDLNETTLDHFEGYRGSKPVRIGNGAYDQLQLDIYGELISAAYELKRLGETLEDDIWRFLPAIADVACRRSGEPDYGLWELRNGPCHVVYSKMMVWMALDRAISMARQYKLPGDVDRWARTRDQMRERVLTRGYDPELGAFTQIEGIPDLDAANLLVGLMELLPIKDPRVQSTIDRTMERLMVNDLVYRYKTDDGLPGEEGGFLLCTCWLVDVLALSDRMDEAYRIFESLIGQVNHLGLFSEQIDPLTGEFLGNFPQGFSHLGLINSALYLAHKEDRKIPVPDLIGTRSHRMEMEG